ncbi:MAG: heavy metal translocating P-type ATPase [Chloroflexota bacterium]
MIFTTIAAIGGISLSSAIAKKRKASSRRSLVSCLRTNTDIVVHREQVQKATPRQPLSAVLRQLLPSASIGSKENLNHLLTLSSATLLINVVSIILLSPLAWLTVPFLLYLAINNVIYAIHNIRQKRIGSGMVDILSTLGPLLTGNFFAAALTFALYFFSRKLLLKTEDDSLASLVDVFGETPKTVWVESENLEVEVSFDSVRVGDIVVVHPGEMIPIDGQIIEGHGCVDQRALTGESQPVEKDVGDAVMASTMLLEGRLRIQVEKAGAETTAAQVGNILKNTVDFKSTVLSRSEKIVDKGAIPTLAFSALALPILGVGGAVAALYASFGYHMRIAGPLGVLNFLRLASENGILIKDGRCLELLRDVDTFVFDKTGTLTEDVPTVGQVYTCNTMAEQTLLAYAAAAEDKQAHPIAHAIRQEASNRGLTFPAITDSKVEMGYGLTVRIEHQWVYVGSARFMEKENIAIPTEILVAQEQCHMNGYSLIYVAVDGQLCGAIELHPTIRPEARTLVDGLLAQGKAVYILSGDHEQPTQKLAQTLGIEHYFAGVLPQNKADVIEQLQAEGKSVCFVGDGINDAIALKKANVSISLAGASTAATDSAGVILMDGTLNKLMTLLDIAHQLDKNLRRGTLMTVIPGILCVAGVFFFNLGAAGAIIWYNLALGGSVANALLPGRTSRQKLGKRTANKTNLLTVEDRAVQV